MSDPSETMRNTGFRVAANRYGHYCVPDPSSWRPASQCVLQGAVWEEKTIEFVRNHAGLGDIIHAGAFFGDFLPALSQALAPGCTLWAFEPNPDNYSAASETCRLNALDNVILHNAALGSKKGVATMKVREGGRAIGGMSAIVETMTAPFDDHISVPVERIDDVVSNRHISIIHLDIEGYEEPALEHRTLRLNQGGFQRGEVRDSLPAGGDSRCQSPIRLTCVIASSGLSRTVIRAGRLRRISRCRSRLW